MPRIEIDSNKKIKKSVIDRIKPIEFTDNHISICLYGKSGTGKTTLWSTFPKPILALVCSGSVKTGELKSISEKDAKYIKNVVIEESSEVIEVCDHLRTSKEYKTLVLDHATGLQDLIIKELLGLEDIPTTKTYGLVSQQQYAQCSIQMKELLRSILSSNTNTVVIAQERDFKREEDTNNFVAPTIGVNLLPQLAIWLNSSVDYICNTFIRQKVSIKTVTLGEGKNKTTKTIEKETDEVEFCLRTYPDSIYITKFRVPKEYKKPKYLVDPNFDKIKNIIEGKYQ